MIKRLTIQGFKDQDRVCDLSGLDLYTSADLNGVGKSSILESFKLALLGEVPGRAKTVEDLLRFTSRREMAVAVLAETEAGDIEVKRRFIRDAPPGEMRPIQIGGIGKRFEEGHRWIKDLIGAVSVCFDPFEFLNLTDAGKRQWIISRSPESRGLGRAAIFTTLFARILETRIGPAPVREMLQRHGIKRWPEILDLCEGVVLDRVHEDLVRGFREKDPQFLDPLRRPLERGFALWSYSRSGEENISAVHAYLKSESLRLKNAVREQEAAIACLGSQGTNGCREPLSALPRYRARIASLASRIENLNHRIRQRRRRLTENTKVEKRVRFLLDRISEMEKRTDETRILNLRRPAEDFRERLLETGDKKKELEETNRLWERKVSTLREREERRAALTREQDSKRELLNKMGTADFPCPLGAGVVCETDLNPYRETLIKEIETLARRGEEERTSLGLARLDLERCRVEKDRLRAKLEKAERTNDELTRRIRGITHEIAAREKESAEAAGKLQAYREELESLESFVGFPEAEGTVDPAVLEQEKEALQAEMEKAEKTMSDLLRRQGKVDALRELARKKIVLEREREAARLACTFLGPEGIQGQIASGIAGALEHEVNDLLHLIGPQYEFALNLAGNGFEMGWLKDGKIIPFQTINSAHFILLIVPFLTAVLRRLARFRERAGWPTLKALCIEAESLTPENLFALLKGLSLMLRRGNLDNVLVAHYHSVRDPRKLCGFTEHILGRDEKEDEEGSEWEAALSGVAWW